MQQNLLPAPKLAHQLGCLGMTLHYPLQMCSKSRASDGEPCCESTSCRTVCRLLRKRDRTYPEELVWTGRCAF